MKFFQLTKTNGNTELVYINLHIGSWVISFTLADVIKYISFGITLYLLISPLYNKHLYYTELLISIARNDTTQTKEIATLKLTQDTLKSGQNEILKQMKLEVKQRKGMK